MQETTQKTKITRGTKKLIERAILNLDPERQNNSNAICEKMVDILFERFDGANLDYQAKRMGIDSTGKILNVLEEYFQHHPNGTLDKTPEID